MEKKHLPDFFIVGAAKSGTTSLYNLLAQHPEIYMSPIKEPNYFSTDIDIDAIRPQVKERLRALNIEGFIEGDMKKTMHRAFIRDREQYEKLFRFAGDAKAVGEASASYLFSKTAASEIKKFNPAAKIIIILRNPVQRAYSHYLMDRRLAFTDHSFSEALDEDARNPLRQWGSASLYLELGLYYEQVKRFLDLFPQGQVLILMSEDLRRDTVGTVKKVYEFLGVDGTFNPDTGREYNVAVVPRNSIVKKLISVNTLRMKVRRALKHSFLKKYVKQALFSKPEDEKPAPEILQKLTEYYRSDILKLSELLNKDLGAWLKTN